MVLRSCLDINQIRYDKKRLNRRFSMVNFLTKEIQDTQKQAQACFFYNSKASLSTN
jgi:hypothetical protein